MRELTLEECSEMVDRALARDKQISPLVSKMLAEREQPVNGTQVLSTIVCVLQDYNRDELLEIIAINLFLKIHSSREVASLLAKIMKDLNLQKPPENENE